MDELVARHALDRIEPVVVCCPSLLLDQVSGLRPVTEQQLQTLAFLHLQQVADRIIAIVTAERFVRQSLEQGVDRRAVAALGNYAQFERGAGEQCAQVDFLVFQVRRQ
ncbi:hypothetical protein D9M73_276140 [compost metagenome]